MFLFLNGLELKNLLTFTSMNFDLAGIVTPEFEVVIGQPDHRVRPGEDARLDCSARGNVNTVDTIEWTRDGQRLPPGEYSK